MQTKYNNYFLAALIICFSLLSSPSYAKGFRFPWAKDKKQKKLEKLLQPKPSSVDGWVTNHSTKEALNKAIVVLNSRQSLGITNEIGYFKIKTSNFDSQIQVVHPNVYSTYYNVAVEPELYTPIGAVRLEPNMVGENTQRAFGALGTHSSYITAKNFLPTVDILQQAGSSDFNSLLTRDASIYEVQNGNGYGSSSLRFRGFNQSLSQVSFNGISLNNPETGAMNTGLYLGMNEWARKTEVSKGLGISQISDINPAGEVNILSFLPKRNSSVEALASYDAGSTIKTSLTLHSGELFDRNFATSLKVDRTAGDGLMDETAFESYSAFLSMFAKAGKHHQFILNSAFKTWDADQNTHSISESDANLFGEDYNYSWGNYQNEPIVTDNNKGLSSLTNLMHQYDISRSSRIVSQLYVHIEHQNALQASNGNLFEQERTQDGLIDFEQLFSANQQLGTTSKADGSALINNTQETSRFGLQSQFINELSKKTNFRLAADYEYYASRHYGTMNNLLGADAYYDAASGNTASENYSTENYRSSDAPHIDHDYRAVINKAGLSAKYEGVGSAYLSNYYLEAAAYYKNLKRKDYFSNANSNSINQFGWRANAGATSILTRKSRLKFLANLSGSPERFKLVFPMQNEQENTNTSNRNIYSAELAYEYRNQTLHLELRAYNSYLSNFSTIQDYALSGNEAYAIVYNLNENHSGVELNTSLQYSKHKLYISAAYGMWNYTSNSKADIYNYNNELNNTTEVQNKGLKVANASPANFKIRNEFNLLRGLELSISYVYSFANYAPLLVHDLSPKTSKQEKLDNYGILSAGINYYSKLKRKGGSFQLFGRVNNILDKRYFNLASTRMASSGEANNYPQYSNLYPSSNRINRGQYNLGLNFTVGMNYCF